MKDFKKLLIWQLGMDIVDKVYDIVPMLLQEEKFGLRSQMTRSAISIHSNIAEGSAKRSTKEYIRYNEIALGSTFELETQTLTVQGKKWVEEKLTDEMLELI